jgi:hypothetical protein
MSCPDDRMYGKGKAIPLLYTDDDGKLLDTNGQIRTAMARYTEFHQMVEKEMKKYGFVIRYVPVKLTEWLKQTSSWECFDEWDFLRYIEKQEEKERVEERSRRMLGLDKGEDK